MSELQPVIDWIVGKWPWLAGVMATARIFAKPISGLLQGFLTKFALYVMATPEADDDVWVTRIVTNRYYRIAAFILDWVLSVKLPTEASLAAVLAAEAVGNKPSPPTVPPIGLWLLCGMLAFGGMTLTGCQTSTPPTKEAIVYYTFRDTWNVAHAAYQGYCELAVQGKVTQRDQQDIDRAWNQFRIGFKLALLTAQKDWSATTPESVVALKTDLITLIRSL